MTNFSFGMINWNSIETIVGEEDLVALRGTIQRTQQGTTLVSAVMWFVRLASGKMVEMWTGSETSR